MRAARGWSFVFVASVVGLIVTALAFGGVGRVTAAPADPGSISGIVRDPSGVPLAGICVNVPNGGGVTTASDGTYLVAGLEPGDHTVQFVDCNPVPVFVGELEKAGFKTSERNVWRWIAAGKVKAFKASVGRTVIPASEFERVLTEGVS